MRRLREVMDLKDKVALVAGGGGHVGSTAAETLAELGAAVVVMDIDEEAGRGVADRLGKLAFMVRMDLADEGSVRDAVRRSAEWGGRIDIVVHAAGLVGATRLDGWAVPFERQTLAAWDRALAVNLGSAFVLAQEAAPHLRSSGSGSIVLVSSIYGSVGPDPSLYEGTEMQNPVAYGASKGGLLQLMRYLANLLAPTVRVNTISPGGIQRGQPSSFIDRYSHRVPLGRLATEDDLRGAIAYLSTDLSAYVTGHDLVVDGGWTAR